MVTTAKELMDLGLWRRFCEETGISIWAVSEGLLDENEKLEWKRG